MKKHLLLSLSLILLFTFAGCKQQDTITTNENESTEAIDNKTDTIPSAKPVTIANAATILSRKEVPVLCYHQVRNWRATDSKSAKDVIVPVETFRETLKILADSGYQTILPDQLYNYLTTGAALPEKPFMLTFDDTDIDQYTTAWPEMKKYGFKGVFFIMTVSINRPPRYMSAEQIKELADAGNAIESHTWNHERVPSYTTPEKWDEQIEKPKARIAEIAGKPSAYFAYPYGLWNKNGIPELKKRGVKAAFILSTERDADDPLYTIRRMIASGHWSAKGVYQSMIKTFRL